MSLKQLDEIMRMWSPRLRDDLDLSPDASSHLASTLSEEIASAQIDLEPPDGPSWNQRKEFFLAYQICKQSFGRDHDAMLAQVHGYPPEAVRWAWDRMFLALDLYVCAMYFVENLADRITKTCADNSAAKKVFSWLRSADRKHLRNAAAHGNWNLIPPDRVVYWAREKGSDPSSMRKRELSLMDTDFFIHLSMTSIWAALVGLGVWRDE